MRSLVIFYGTSLLSSGVPACGFGAFTRGVLSFFALAAASPAAWVYPFAVPAVADFTACCFDALSGVTFGMSFEAAAFSAASPAARV